MSMKDKVNNIPKFVYWGAFRYYLGRSSIAASAMQDWLIDNAQNIPSHVRDHMIKELSSAEEDTLAAVPEDVRVAWLRVKMLFQSLQSDSPGSGGQKSE